MSSTLVTGARGFVGTHLRRHLTDCGDQVVGIDRDVEITDRGALRAAIPPDCTGIVHLGGLSHVGASFADPDAYSRVNAGGTAALLAAAADAAPEAVVIVVSTSDVYGVVDPGELPLTESHPVRPVSPYARSKVEAEQVAMLATERGQRVIVVRPFAHVGPGQSDQFVVPAVARRLLAARDEGRATIAVGDVSARRDLTDVRDVVRAYRLLLHHGRPGVTYHVCSGVDVAIGDVVAALARRIAPNVGLRPDPALMRPVEVPALRGSFARLHEATGWEPRIPLATTLDDVVAWISRIS